MIEWECLTCGSTDPGYHQGDCAELAYGDKTLDGVPYRPPEPEEDEWCRAENCEYRHWRSGPMPTHKRGTRCPQETEETEESVNKAVRASEVPGVREAAVWADQHFGDVLNRTQIAHLVTGVLGAAWPHITRKALLDLAGGLESVAGSLSEPSGPEAQALRAFALSTREIVHNHYERITDDDQPRDAQRAEDPRPDHGDGGAAGAAHPREDAAGGH